MVPANGDALEKGTDKEGPPPPSELNSTVDTMKGKKEAKTQDKLKENQIDEKHILTEKVKEEAAIDTKKENMKEKDHVEIVQSLKTEVTGNDSSVKIKQGNKIENNMKCENDKIPVTEPLFEQKQVETVESIQEVKESIIDAAKHVVKKVVEKIDDKIESEVEKEEMKETTEDNIKTDKENNKNPVTEPFFEQNQVETVESIQDVKESTIDAAKHVAKKVSEKIDDKIESKVGKEEITPDNVKTGQEKETGKQDMIDDINAAAKSIVNKVVGQIDQEKVEDKKIGNISDTFEKKKEEKSEISSDMNPVIEPIFVQEHIEPLGSIQDVQDGIFDAARSVVQKVVEKIDNKIESNAQKEELRDIMDKQKKEGIVDISEPKTPASKHIFTQETSKSLDSIQSVIKKPVYKTDNIEVRNNITSDDKIKKNGNHKDMIPAIEPVFIQENIEPLESIQDFQESIIGAAKSVVKKVVDKIDNKIESVVEKEESRDFTDNENKNEIRIEGMGDKMIPVKEAIFTQENVETLKSIPEPNDGITDTAKSAVQEASNRDENDFGKQEEKTEIGIKFLAPDCKGEPIELMKARPDITQYEPKEGDVHTDSEIKNVKEPDNIEISEDNDKGNIIHCEEISGKQEDIGTITDNIAKLQAPSFTQLIEEAVKDVENTEKVVDVASDANGEDYYWITLGSIIVGALAVLGTLLYFYIN